MAGQRYVAVVSDDTWASLADQFADEAYASVKGYVRTYVMHHQLLDHLPPSPATVLDVGGGAGHQSFPLAQAGYQVTLLDSSPAMLAKARQRLERLPAEARHRVAFIEADGEHASRGGAAASASPPCCAMACSAISTTRNRWSAQLCGAQPTAASCRS